MTEETDAFANALIFEGMTAELREGCIRVAAGTIVEVGEAPRPGDGAGLRVFTSVFCESAAVRLRARF